MQRFFGFDVSGYSSGRCGLAEIRVDGAQISATVYREHPFAARAKGKALLRETAAPELQALKHLTSLGVVLVDVPHDVDHLLDRRDRTFVWELTARPIDFAYGALRPLADRIGAAVSRFRHLLSVEVLPNLRETYPAASLAASGLEHEQYKGKPIVWDAKAWVGGRLAQIASSMRLVGTAGLVLTDDEVDALLCAYAGAAPVEDILVGDTLTLDMKERLVEKIQRDHRHHLERFVAPQNYQLFRRPPSFDIQVDARSWSDLET